MANLTSEIENLRKDLERSRMELRRMHLELGEAAFSWHDAIGYEPSQEAFSRLIETAQKKANVQNDIDKLKTALDNMSSSDKRIEQTKVSMKELDERYNVLISSLGAVATEIDSQGKLPSRLEKCLEPMHEYEKHVKDLEERHQKCLAENKNFAASVYERRLRRYTRKLNDVFTQTGRRIYNSGDFREVPGQRAKGILDEMEQIRFMKRNYKNDILDNKNVIDEAQGSLRTLGAYGEENRKLRELQGLYDSLTDQLSERCTEYGSILADGMQVWMDEQAPEVLMKCCSQIIKQENRITQQALSLEHVMMERDIEIHNLQSTQLAEQMNHLNSQIQAIEKQKSELQARLDAELKAISDLKMRQNELSRQASMMQ